MPKETMFDSSLRHLRATRGWKVNLSLAAAVEPTEIEKLIADRDERVVNAVLSITGHGGTVRAIETEVKKFIEKIIRSAAWDKRLYAVFGPTGIGKTFAINAILSTIQAKVSYIRINEYNKSNKFALLQQIHKGFNLRGMDGASSWRSNRGNPYYYKLLERFENENGVIVIDEAQKLRDSSFEMLRDLYDETNVSMVIIGSTAFAMKLATKKIGDEIFGQLIRRFDDRYELPHATPKDVRLFLSAYGVQISNQESDVIAKKISQWGDIDTLAKAMRFIAADIKDGELSWSKVGAGNIIDAVKRVIMLMELKSEDNGSEN